MKTIVICDDNIEAVNMLKESIEEQFPNEFQINGYISAKQLVYEFEDGFLLKTDLLFIALEVQEIGALVLAKQIQEKLPLLKIIFTTGCPERAEDIFDGVRPYGLLLKPFNGSKLRRYIESIQEDQYKNKEYISLRKNGGIQFIPLEKIQYVESKGRKLIMHLLDGEECMNQRISLFVEQNQNKIIRCHQSYAVNWDYVTAITAESVKLKNGECVPVSKKQYREIRSHIS